MPLDFAPEFGVPFELIGPDGTRASFNNKADPDDVGVLTGISGLDSAEVRESGENLTAFDGGIAGPNYYGRRPLVLEGLVYGHGSTSERATKLAKLTRATNAMRGDALLRWTPSGFSAPVFLTVRRQQPLKIDGGWNKTFQASLVASDPRIYSNTSQSASLTNIASTLTAVNNGNTETFPIYTISGPITNPMITNQTSGATMRFVAGLLAEDQISIDTLNRTIMRNQRMINYYPNPGFQGATHYLTGDAATVLSIQTQSAVIGGRPPGISTKCLQVARASTAAENAVSFTYPNAYVGIQSLPAGTRPFTVSLSHMADAVPVDGTPRIDFIWKNSAGTVLGITGSVTSLKSSTTGWSRFVGTANAFAGTGTHSLDVKVTFQPNHGASLTKYWVDMFVIEQGATFGVPFSGDVLPTGLGWGTSGVSGWAGTANDSISYAYPTSPSFMTSWYSIVDFANTRWTGLQSGTNTLSLSASSSGTGFSMRSDWRNAWL